MAALNSKMLIYVVGKLVVVKFSIKSVKLVSIE